MTVCIIKILTLWDSASLRRRRRIYSGSQTVRQNIDGPVMLFVMLQVVPAVVLVATDIQLFRSVELCST